MYTTKIHLNLWVGAFNKDSTFSLPFIIFILSKLGCSVILQWEGGLEIIFISWVSY